MLDSEAVDRFCTELKSLALKPGPDEWVKEDAAMLEILAFAVAEVGQIAKLATGSFPRAARVHCVVLAYYAVHLVSAIDMVFPRKSHNVVAKKHDIT